MKMFRGSALPVQIWAQPNESIYCSNIWQAVLGDDRSLTMTPDDFPVILLDAQHVQMLQEY
jgi:hypothetical protein